MPLANGNRLDPRERNRGRRLQDAIHDAGGVKTAASKPLGTQRFRLLGTSPFSPDRHKGHKMAVRGHVDQERQRHRINVTSFQMLAETCAK